MFINNNISTTTTAKNSNESKRTSAINPVVDVTITSDLICPWCQVGLKKLQEASELTNSDLNITWKPFLLRPDMPMEGNPKGGSPESRVGSYLGRAGESVGINFTGLTDRTPDTLLFHSTMKMLQDDPEVDSKAVTRFQEAVFLGYFTPGEYPDHDGLLAAASRVDTEANGRTIYDRIKALYEEGTGEQLLAKLVQDVKQENLQARRLGISGVPSFSFGRESNNAAPVFSGAQPTEVFVKFLEENA